MNPKSGRGPATTDPVEIFAMLMHFGGDIPRTALALALDERELAELARRHNWCAKLDDYGIRQQAGSLDQVRSLQQHINRVVIYITAHRLRNIIGDLLRRMLDDPRLFDAMTTVTSTHGTRRDFRVLVDLAKALKTVSNITYRALGDFEALGEPKRAAPTPNTDLLWAARTTMDAADRNPAFDSHETVRTNTQAREDRAR